MKSFNLLLKFHKNPSTGDYQLQNPSQHHQHLPYSIPWYPADLFREALYSCLGHDIHYFENPAASQLARKLASIGLLCHFFEYFKFPHILPIQKLKLYKNYDEILAHMAYDEIKNALAKGLFHPLLRDLLPDQGNQHPEIERLIKLHWNIIQQGNTLHNKKIINLPSLTKLYNYGYITGRTLLPWSSKNTQVFHYTHTTLYHLTNTLSIQDLVDQQYKAILFEIQTSTPIQWDIYFLNHKNEKVEALDFLRN